MERDVRVEQQEREEHFLPQPPSVQLLQTSLSPAASRPRPGASCGARSQLSLLCGGTELPRSPPEEKAEEEERAGTAESSRGCAVPAGPESRGAREWPEPERLHRGQLPQPPPRRYPNPTPPRPDFPGSALSPRDNPGPTGRHQRRREWSGHAQPCHRYLRGAHAAAVTTIAGRPVPFLVTAATAAEQLTSN